MMWRRWEKIQRNNKREIKERWRREKWEKWMQMVKRRSPAEKFATWVIGYSKKRSWKRWGWTVSLVWSKCTTNLFSASFPLIREAWHSGCSILVNFGFCDLKFYFLPKWWSRSGNALALRTVYSVCYTFGVHAENHRGEKEENKGEKKEGSSVSSFPNPRSGLKKLTKERKKWKFSSKEKRKGDNSPRRPAPSSSTMCVMPLRLMLRTVYDTLCVIPLPFTLRTVSGSRCRLIWFFFPPPSFGE